MTDGRYSSLHMTDNALLAHDLDLAPPNDPSAWLITEFDDDVPVPPERDPPKPDEDDTLPSKAHPSYPYGRPYTPSHHLTNPSSLSLAHNLFSLSAQSLGRSSSSATHGWAELGLRDLLAVERGKEIPPGMAGAKRGPEDDRSESESEEGTVRDDDGGPPGGGGYAPDALNGLEEEGGNTGEEGVMEYDVAESDQEEMLDEEEDEEVLEEEEEGEDPSDDLEDDDPLLEGGREVRRRSNW